MFRVFEINKEMDEMFISEKHLVAPVVAVFISLFGSLTSTAGVIENKPQAACRNLPVVKNLTGLRAQPACDEILIPKELTRGDVRKLAATTKSSDDHLTIAHWYRDLANSLEAKAAGYEVTAANLRHAPAVKNIISPSTRARLEFAAEGFRMEANSDRALAASHEEMAKTAVANAN